MTAVQSGLAPRRQELQDIAILPPTGGHRASAPQTRCDIASMATPQPGLGREFGIPGMVGFSTHFQPRLDRLRPPCPGRRVSGVLRGAPENVCRIAQIGVATASSGTAARPRTTARTQPPTGVFHTRWFDETSERTNDSMRHHLDARTCYSSAASYRAKRCR